MGEFNARLFLREFVAKIDSHAWVSGLEGSIEGSRFYLEDATPECTCELFRGSVSVYTVFYSEQTNSD